MTPSAPAPATVLLRPAAPTDRGYVLEHWVRAHSHTAEAFHAGPNFVPGKWAEAEAIFDRSQCLVACAGADAAVVLGFAVVEPGDPPILHYVYVRETNRRDGIAKQLLAPLLGTKGVRYSHLPPHHAVIRGRVVIVPKKHGPAPAQLPIPESWVYDPACRMMGPYAVEKKAS